MIRHFLSKQFLGFVAVGGTAALLHWLARILMSEWLSFPVAVCLAYVLGMLVAFVLNKQFIFVRSSRPIRLQIRDFVLINLAFAPVVWVSAVSLNHFFEQVSWSFYPEALAHGIAIALPMLATFLIYKFFTFGGTDEQ